MGRRAKANRMITLFHLGWHWFLVAALILTLAWYAVILLLFRQKKQPAVLSPAEEAEDEFEHYETSGDPDGLLGQSVLPDGISEVPAHELVFVNRELQQGLVPDVLEELRSIFHVLETERGTKQDFISLFRLVSAKYRALAGTPSQRALNDYIRENALFPISDQELDHLWT
jgi:hypothetical protein